MRLTNNHSGILYMIVAAFVLTIMDVLAKLLIEDNFSPFQILAIRGWIVSICFLFWMKIHGQLSRLKTKRVKHYIFRGIIGFFAPFFFFTALGTMPLADTVVIFFAAPLIMTALSVPFLKEIVGPFRWAAIIIGFMGVIFIVQPGGKTYQIGVIYALAGCFAYSIIQIMTRWMSTTEPPFRIVFYFNFATMIIGSLALPFVWKPMNLQQFSIIILMALTAIIGHTCMTRAFTRAPVSVVAPFEYSFLIWSTLLGFLIWGDFPSNNVWIGATIIILSGAFIFYRENKA